MVRTQDFHCYVAQVQSLVKELKLRGAAKKEKKRCWDFGKFHGLSEARK